MEENNFKNKRYNIYYFIISFVIVFTISFLVLFIIEKRVRTVKFEEIKINEERIVNLENEFLGKEFSGILGDLNYLHYAYKDEFENSSNYAEIAENWIIFSTQKNIYDQIRYIDKDGNEKIRINLDKDGSYSVIDSNLQNKKDRYYFYDTIKLMDGDIHISPLDLNIENGEIEEPYKPMIRFSTPIYDTENNIQGIIVLNYLADKLLKNFKRIGLNNMGEIVLLNSDGYWLSNSNSDLEWNFMFEDKKDKKFGKDFYDEWEEIKNADNQIITTNGLFTFSKVNLENKIIVGKKKRSSDIYLADGNWYIVSNFYRNKDNSVYFLDDNFEIFADVLKKNVIYFLFVLLASGIIASLTYVNRKTYTKIKYYSEYDTLTKAFNRRAGILKLNGLFPTDERRSFLVSLCFIDINGLKKVNDTLGHKSGDELIISASNVIKNIIREQDFLIRMGGDEFLIVFNGIGKDFAEEIWTRIKKKYEEINNNENRDYIISVSHGIVDYDNNSKSKVDDLIKVADEKMYEEKKIIKENFKVLR